MKTDNERRGGSNFTSPGTLPPDHLKRHKIDAGTIVADGVSDLKILNGWSHRGKLKTLLQMYSLYRLQSHNVIVPKLAKPFVISAGYFLNSMRSETRNRDRAPQTGNIEGQGATDNAPATGVATTY